MPREQGIPSVPEGREQNQPSAAVTSSQILRHLFSTTSALQLVSGEGLEHG